MKNFRFFICIPLLLILNANSCDKDGNGNIHSDTRLKLANKSDSSVVTFLQYNFPDTTLSLQNPKFDFGKAAMTVDSKMAESYYSRRNWEKVIGENSLNTVMIFVVSQSIYVKQPWDSIQKNYSIIKRYDLRINQLKAQNWKVIYP